MARSPIRSVLIAATLAAIVGSTTSAAAQPSVTMDSSPAERRELESIETQSHTATALYVVSVVELIGSPTLALFGLAQGVGCVFAGGECSAMDALYVSSVVSGVLGLVTLGIAIALDVDTTARAHRLRLGMRTSSSSGVLTLSGTF